MEEDKNLKQHINTAVCISVSICLTKAYRKVCMCVRDKGKERDGERERKK